MHPTRRGSRLWFLLLIALAGCAGFRGGWQSYAYIGEAPPVLPRGGLSSPSVRDRPTLRVPGLELQVELNNQRRTYDTRLYLYVVPLSVDLRETDSNISEAGMTRVFVTVIPSEAGFVFLPSAASLSVRGESVAATSGHVFGKWDRDGNRVQEGGTWGYRPIDEAFPLAEPGRRYHLAIDFATPLPSPRSRDIAVDLSRALIAKQCPPLPLIRFTPVRWKEGYS